MPDLQEYLRMFDNLKVNKRHGALAPHKPCLLLAVMDLVESGAITDGYVRYTPMLREIFSEYFAIVSKPEHRDRPYLPFFHLHHNEDETFWTIKVKEGRQTDFERMKPSHRQMEDCIEYAEIDYELFRYIQSSADRKIMREHLIRRWFPDYQEALNNKLAFHRDSNSYERALREAVAGEPVVSEAPPVRSVRDSAFRRLVLEAYDYRCAASGWRLIVPESHILVQAAHLIPHSKSQDDDPRNGIALTPNFHWALDQHIIAPGPDMKWHLSKVIDKRIPDNQPLIELEGKAVICPTKRSMLPRKDALEWRLERLLPAA